MRYDKYVKRVCSMLEPLAGDSAELRREKRDACSQLQQLVEGFVADNPAFRFTYQIETQALRFTCPHPGKYEFLLGRTLGAYRRRGDWGSVYDKILAGHRRRCPEIRGNKS